MGEQLDPRDKSKPFGSKLWDLVEAVQEFEHDDFVEQLSDISYTAFMTPEEHIRLYAWATGSMFDIDAEIKDLLRKCPHQYATAVWLELTLRDLPKETT